MRRTLECVFLLTLATLALGQDQAVVRPGPKGQSDLEHAMLRAAERAKHEAATHMTSIARMSITPEAKERAAWLVMIEYKDGTLALWQSGSEELADQYAVASKEQMQLLGEGCTRR